MHPAHLLTVKQRILKSSATHTRTIAQKMLRVEDPYKLRKLLDRLNF
jgi:phosphoenolpyruvate-protein kinase (PTS system EI component)